MRQNVPTSSARNSRTSGLLTAILFRIVLPHLRPISGVSSSGRCVRNLLQTTSAYYMSPHKRELTKTAILAAFYVHLIAVYVSVRTITGL